RHPGIVDICEVGIAEAGAYIVMEYLEGESLGQRLCRPGTSLATTLRLFRQIASALGAAHERGVVHRDLKPDNVMIVKDGDVVGGERVKVLDFGIAKLAAEHWGPGTTDLRTRAGMVMGTPAYMSPEQCRGV